MKIVAAMLIAAALGAIVTVLWIVWLGRREEVPQWLGRRA